MSGVARRFLLIVVLASLVVSCSQSEEVIPIENRSAQEIFTDAEFLLADGNTLAAARMFEEVERLYPYSPWARRSVIMSAFAYHEAKRFTQSRASAERFLDFYPADKDAPYAQYLIALSHYDQIVDVSRDQSETFEALQALRESIERYPDSEFAKSAELKFDLALAHLAGKEMEVGRYYLKKRHYSAAINRFRVVVQEFQTTEHIPEALHRLAESYLSLGLTDEAQTAGAILGYNYQGSIWYQDTYRLLTDAGLEAEATGQGWLQRIYRQVIRGKWL